jgi:hypothetical protein
VSDQEKLTGKYANHVAVFLVPSFYSEVSQNSHFHKSEIRIVTVVIVVVYKSSVFTEIITFLQSGSVIEDASN